MKKFKIKNERLKTVEPLGGDRIDLLNCREATPPALHLALRTLHEFLIQDRPMNEAVSR